LWVAFQPTSPSQALLLSRHTGIENFSKEPSVADETDQGDPSDEQGMHRQFATVFEHLINLARFTLPLVLVLLDDTDHVIGSQAVETSDNPHALEAINFVVSPGVEDGLSYPMHVMVHDARGQVAYVSLDDLDTQPEIQIVHIVEEECGLPTQRLSGNPMLRRADLLSQVGEGAERTSWFIGLSTGLAALLSD